jgi:hypothetical protein
MWSSFWGQLYSSYALLLPAYDDIFTIPRAQDRPSELRCVRRPLLHSRAADVQVSSCVRLAHPALLRPGLAIRTTSGRLTVAFLSAFLVLPNEVILVFWARLPSLCLRAPGPIPWSALLPRQYSPVAWFPRPCSVQSQLWRSASDPHKACS